MIHINNFIDKIKAFESRRSQTFSMTMQEAKDLHADITKLLLALQELQQPVIRRNPDPELRIEIKGEDW